MNMPNTKRSEKEIEEVTSMADTILKQAMAITDFGRERALTPLDKRSDKKTTDAQLAAKFDMITPATTASACLSNAALQMADMVIHLVPELAHAYCVEVSRVIGDEGLLRRVYEQYINEHPFKRKH
jgi:hypothetical protein